MDVVAFHKNLLGIDQDKTPEAFRLTQLHEDFYKAAAERDVRGFSATPAQPHVHEERFLATFVLAISMTEGLNKVLMAVPEPHHDWVKERSESVFRHVFRQRKGHKTKVIVALRASLKRIDMTACVLQMPEPERWVAFGFQNDDTLPEWIEGRLL